MAVIVVVGATILTLIVFLVAMGKHFSSITPERNHEQLNHNQIKLIIRDVVADSMKEEFSTAFATICTAPPELGVRRVSEELLYPINKSSKDEETVSDYKELAKIYSGLKDKEKSIAAAEKYIELKGETPETCGFLGYIYWCSGDVDSAIAHTEHALQLTDNIEDKENAKKHIIGLKNNLAYYYAENRVNKAKALSYMEDVLNNIPPESRDYLPSLDTKGYVLLNFAESKEDIEEALEYLLKALQTELQDRDRSVVSHTIEALEKLKAIKNNQ